MAVKGRVAYFSECKVEREPLEKKDQRFHVLEQPHFFSHRLLHCFICQITCILRVKLTR